jgi:hypothetical protein
MLDSFKIKKCIENWWYDADIKRVVYKIDEWSNYNNKKKDVEYNLKYELEFIPDSLDMIAIYIWIDHNGYIGIGIENYCRVSKRFNIDIYGRSKMGFVAGHQPIEVDIESILEILTLAKTGKFYVCLRRLPFLIYPRIAILNKSSDYFQETKYNKLANIKMYTTMGMDCRKYTPWQ